MDPLRHYLKHGWHEGRNPSNEFDTLYYLEQFPELVGGLESPIEHYVRIGKQANAKTIRQIPTGKSQSQEDKNWAAKTLDLIKLLGFDTTYLDRNEFSRFTIHLFDAAWYCRAKGLPPETTQTEAFARYVAFDLMTGLGPGPLFDPDYYAEAARKAALPPGAPSYQHWLDHGVPKRVIPTPLFDEQTYLDLNKDLQRYSGWVFEHWIRHGIKERRLFDLNLRLPTPLMKDVPSAQSRTQWSVSNLAANRQLTSTVSAMREFRASSKFRTIVEYAATFEPAIATISQRTQTLLPPVYDGHFHLFRAMVGTIPSDRYRNVVLVPFCKLGGADYVAGLLARTLQGLEGSTLVLRLDAPDWDRPDWFPPTADVSDLSGLLDAVPRPEASLLLYHLLRWLQCDRVFNVNSRRGFEVVEKFGPKLGMVMQLYAYFFCADRTPEGIETGYPVWYFAS